MKREDWWVQVVELGGRVNAAIHFESQHPELAITARVLHARNLAKKRIRGQQ